MGKLCVTGIFLGSLAWMATAVGCGAALPTAAERTRALSSEISERELKELLIAAGHEDWRIRRRAIQELLPLVNSRYDVRKALLEHLTGPGAHFTSDLAIVALGTAKGNAANDIVRAYSESSAKRKNALRYVLGRMGGEAAEAAPGLRKELADPKTDPRERIAGLLVLGSIGQATEEELDAVNEAILSEIKSGRTVWESPTTAGTLAIFGRNEWVGESIRRSLIQAVRSSNGEIRVDAALALATLGNRIDGQTRNALAESFESAMKHADESAAYVGHGFSLAIADPSRRKTVLRTVAKAHHENWGRGTLASIDWICGSLEDNGVKRDIIALLDDPSPAVRAEAALMLGAIARPARDAQVDLLRRVEFDRDEDVQEESARALARVADRACVAELERLRRKFGPNASLADDIDESIRIITLGQTRQ